MLIMEKDGKTSAFNKIKGHVMTETTEGSLEIWFTENHTHDTGANEQNIFMRLIGEEKKNKEVNL
jgi:hypothetical protein